MILVFLPKLRINLPLDYNGISLNPNSCSHKDKVVLELSVGSRRTKSGVRFEKMALILIVLLFAGIGFTLGQAGTVLKTVTAPCRYILLTIDMLGKLRRILLDCQLCSLTVEAIAL